jgi:ABC-type histidine transport system ATPase subunit
VPRKLADGRRAGGKVLAQQLDDDGYPTVKLGGKRVRVAIAVQLAFAGPPQVLHLDDDRQNSRPENLAWGSKVVNEQMKGGTERGKAGSGRCVPPSRIGTPETPELR